MRPLVIGRNMISSGEENGMVRIACVGGFPGAGKTTALIAAARNLTSRGLRVGVIANDQGSNLVDTALFRGLGLQTEEITGGCFCCRFSELVKHASRLVGQHCPDIILAEAVGSCTDLAATVYEPLRRFHSSQYELAPLSVFVEPARIRELLGPSSQFESSVRYLFEKQLAEAELIILSKSELLNLEELESLTEQLQKVARETPILSVSAKTGAGVNEWVDRILSARPVQNAPLDLDYAIYGQAEASLGWLNATVELVSGQEFLLAELGKGIVVRIREQCRVTNSAIAHVKILLVTSGASDRIALTTGASAAAWDGEGNLGLVSKASAVINARVGANPEALRRMVESALQAAAREQGVSATMQHLESFAPLPPQRPASHPAD
jgi:Ni2+-binding GTPase involved in maturation of urease and hydrogenase